MFRLDVLDAFGPLDMIMLAVETESLRGSGFNVHRAKFIEKTLLERRNRFQLKEIDLKIEFFFDTERRRRRQGATERVEYLRDSLGRVVVVVLAVSCHPARLILKAFVKSKTHTRTHAQT